MKFNLLEWDIPIIKVEIVITDNDSKHLSWLQIAYKEEDAVEEEEVVDEVYDFEERERFAHTLQLVMQNLNQSNGTTNYIVSWKVGEGLSYKVEFNLSCAQACRNLSFFE